MAKTTKLEEEMAKMLTEDLISEILVRLPVISLLRCRCVCKAWFRLIQNPNFINTHLKHSSTNQNRILLTHSLEDWTHFLSIHAYESLDLITSVEMEIPQLDYYSIKFSDPCNGLICLLDVENTLVLYNPALGEYKHLPRRPFPCRKGWLDHVIGFGFGSVSNPDDYKVVSIVSFNELSDSGSVDSYYDSSEDDDDDGSSEEDDGGEDIEGGDEDNMEEDDGGEDIEGGDEDNMEEDDHDDIDNVDGEDNEDIVDSEDDEEQPVKRVEVYNLSTNSWREIECDCPYSINGYEYATLFNGVLHWAARKEGVDVILTFDMSSEVLGDMELPKDILRRSGINKSLTILNNSLALLAYTNHLYNAEQQFIDIWVMKDYGAAESWTKQVRIGPLAGISCPLLLWKNEALLLESTNGQLLSCPLDTQEIEDSEIQGVRGLMRLMVFHESLISLL